MIIMELSDLISRRKLTKGIEPPLNLKFYQSRIDNATIDSLEFAAENSIDQFIKDFVISELLGEDAGGEVFNFNNDEIDYITFAAKYAINEFRKKDKKKTSEGKNLLRKDGSRYVSHSLELVSIIREATKRVRQHYYYSEDIDTHKNKGITHKSDYITIVGTLLHDLIEDTDVKFEDILRDFSKFLLSHEFSGRYQQDKFADELPEVLDLIDRLTKKDDEHYIRDYLPRATKRKGQFPKNATRAITIKLADQHHNVAHMESILLGEHIKPRKTRYGWYNMHPDKQFDRKYRIRAAVKAFSAIDRAEHMYVHKDSDAYPLIRELQMGAADAVYDRLLKERYQILIDKYRETSYRLGNQPTRGEIFDQEYWHALPSDDPTIAKDVDGLRTYLKRFCTTGVGDSPRDYSINEMNESEIDILRGIISTENSNIITPLQKKQIDKEIERAIREGTLFRVTRPEQMGESLNVLDGFILGYLDKALATQYKTTNEKDAIDNSVLLQYMFTTALPVLMLKYISHPEIRFNMDLYYKNGD